MGESVNTDYRTLRQECLIYFVVWILIFLFPVINEMFASTEDDPFVWEGIIKWWIGVIPFFVLFLLHRMVFVPNLFIKGKIKFYAIAVILSLCVFGCVQHAMIEDRHHKPHHAAHHPSPHPPSGHHGHKPPPKRPDPVVNMILNCGVAVLVLGFNLSIVLIFRRMKEREIWEAGEKLRLHEELKYLRSQVNPHFFMNMLNNIHAMVDIDPQRAKKVIIELSKLMRHTLYTADSQSVSLESEMQFISNYINLMRIRYPDDIVTIRMDLPSGNSSETRLPPLLFMPLLENAFKHGVSYMSETYIDIRVREYDNYIEFYCMNTKPRHAVATIKGGLGLNNVRRRLDLLYGADARLVITDKEESYTVTLTIPIKYENKMLGH